MSKSKHENNLPDEKTQILTPERVDVSKRVKDGRTRLFFTKEDAKAFADQIRSYLYPATDSKDNLIGYCVPK